MTSKIKVDNITNQSDSNIVNKCGTTITLGASGDTISLASGASQTGFGRTGTVDWQTGDIKTATFTATNGEGYFCNTSGGAFTVNLPAGSAGAIVSVADYTRTFQTNNLTISPDGSEKIGGTAADLTLNVEGQALTLIYVDGTEGWINVQNAEDTLSGESFIAATGGTITTCGNCKIHTFTGPGTFCVSSISSVSSQNIISYMVVAGGGGGGRGCAGAGGGAGGFREVKNPVTPYTASPLDGYSNPSSRVTITSTAYPIVVGGGGTGSSTGCSATDGTSGSNSTFSTIISAGGGAGGGSSPGCSGGSGGGGGHNAGTGGSGNTPPVSPAQGNPGANSAPATGSAPSDAGGGGGGATAGASNCGAPGPTGHAGGDGATTSISATPTTYAGGGGGTNRCGGGPTDTQGGSGGGGRGGFGSRPTPDTNMVGVAGTTNTGGGGGGGKRKDVPSSTRGGGGAGGSGIVVIRYKFQ